MKFKIYSDRDIAGTVFTIAMAIAIIGALAILSAIGAFW